MIVRRGFSGSSRLPWCQAVLSRIVTSSVGAVGGFRRKKIREIYFSNLYVRNNQIVTLTDIAKLFRIVCCRFSFVN